MMLNVGLRLVAPSATRPTISSIRLPLQATCVSPASFRPLSTAIPNRLSLARLRALRPMPFRFGIDLFPSSSLRRLSTSPATFAATPPPEPSPSPAKQPLSEDILTLPNLLTISRLVLTPYIGYLVATHQFIPAVSLLFVASITDLLDGWLARRTGKYTVFGSIADPAADKALVTTMVVSLAMSGMLPWTMATIILGRDVALVVSAFIIRYKTLAEPKTLARYFNPSLPSATVTPTQISKYNTFLQLVLLGLLTLYPIIFPGQPSPGLTFSSSSTTTASEPGRGHGHGRAIEVVNETREKLAHKGLLSQQTKQWIDKGITSLMWITAATTVWSGLGYIGGAGTHTVLARAKSVSSKVKQSSAKPSSKPPA